MQTPTIWYLDASDTSSEGTGALHQYGEFTRVHLFPTELSDQINVPDVWTVSSGCIFRAGHTVPRWQPVLSNEMKYTHPVHRPQKVL